MNHYWVEVRYVVVGRLRVSSESEDTAREDVLEEMTFPGTCEIVDWEILGVEDMPAVDEHGRPL